MHEHNASFAHNALSTSYVSFFHCEYTRFCLYVSMKGNEDVRPSKVM
jgi:hypothetical protein